MEPSNDPAATGRRPRVVIVEDEADVARLLAFNLGAAAIDVVTADSVASATRTLTGESPFDVVLVDRLLPDGDGLVLCDVLRRQQRDADTAVLVLSALGTETDRLAGLGAGADDYVVKPFSIHELVARIRTLLRFVADRRVARAARRAPRTHRLVFRDVEVDVDRHEVTVAGEHVELRPIEYRLLVTLLGSPLRDFGRRDLLSVIWGVDDQPKPRAIDVHIRRLRERLGHAAGAVQTIPGGYRLARD